MSTVEPRQAEQAGRPRLGPPEPTSSGRPGWLPSNATMVMVAAGAAFFVLGLLAVGDGPPLRVWAASADVTAGTTLTAGMVEAVELRAADEVASRLVPADRPVAGEVTANSLQAGELLSAGDLRSAVAGDGARPLAIAVPVSQVRAVGGRVQVGDRVDVVRVVSGEAEWVARDLRVLAVGAAGSTAGLGGGWQVTVAVDEATAGRLVVALDAGEVTVVRSTGARAAAR